MKKIGEQVEGEVFAAEDLKDLKIMIGKAPGEKCERCWIYTEDIGSDPNHPEICARCAGEID